MEEKKRTFIGDLKRFQGGEESKQKKKKSIIFCAPFCRNYTKISGYKDGIDQQFLEEISLVWLLVTDPPTPKAHLIMAILYSIMMCVGFLGNAFVIGMFVK